MGVYNRVAVPETFPHSSFDKNHVFEKLVLSALLRKSVMFEHPNGGRFRSNRERGMSN